MQCLSSTNEQFLKTDLINELKLSKDIAGVKKLKVERAKMEDRHSTAIYGEASRQFTPQNFVDTVVVVNNTHKLSAPTVLDELFLIFLF